jgi:hypothetical protein
MSGIGWKKTLAGRRPQRHDAPQLHRTAARFMAPVPRGAERPVQRRNGREAPGDASESTLPLWRVAGAASVEILA